MLNQSQVRPVVLVGAGSIGGYVALLLAKAGVTDITVYDDDVVESHNVPMSVYREVDIGRRKIDALKERIDYETGAAIQGRAEKFGDQPISRCSLICCIDQMDQEGYGRIPIWKRVRDSLQVDIMIDTRIERWYGEIYAIVPTLSEDRDNYGLTLLPDEQMANQVCGYHGIGSMSAAVAGDAVNTLFRYWNESDHDWRYGRRYDTLAEA